MMTVILSSSSIPAGIATGGKNVRPRNRVIPNRHAEKREKRIANAIALQKEYLNKKSPPFPSFLTDI
jgi:hypothetical protein